MIVDVDTSKMNFTLLAVLATLATCFASVPSETKTDLRSEDAETVGVNDDGNRDKRGFLLTPLTALPAEAIVPLLPFLRAVVPPPILAKIAPLLPTAPIVDASASNQTTLPGLIAATAPLISNLNRQTADQKTALLQAGNAIVAVQQVPAISPAVVTTPAIAAPLHNFGLTLPAIKVQSFPPAPPTVPQPALLSSNYILQSNLLGQSNFISSPLTAFPSTQYFGRSIFV